MNGAHKNQKKCMIFFGVKEVGGFLNSLKLIQGTLNYLNQCGGSLIQISQSN